MLVSIVNEPMEMDTPSEECSNFAVYDKTPNSTQNKYNLVIRPNYTVEKVFRDVSIQFPYDSYDLIMQPIDEKDSMIYLNDIKSNKVEEIPGFVPQAKNFLIILPPGEWEKSSKERFEISLGPVHQQQRKFSMVTMTDSLNLSPMTPDPVSDDDLALGASASPTESDPINGTSMMLLPISSPNNHTQIGPITQESFEANESNRLKSYSRPSDMEYGSLVSQHQPPAAAYVGLVNQAMTCYLNSLLQALYMTPEFRNALYRWEFDNDNEAKSIPYQLQKLFLNLQTSKKAAVETTDLTRSFGWDSREAWEQHDIQEMCRVMFDALEHKFKNTKQAHLISNLYEGKMIDYVKCLECNTEKTRADTFLDIPLPVRPFGSSVAYGSIEEALRAFVQPETLNGNNQYFCEKCNKECDAHKGLKFKNFPYILTLHLKRFDFDYQTMHRIKLNDKVTFPQTLNLNTFINATDAQTFSNLNNVHMNGFASTSNNDDCSTTDSGSAMEDDSCSGIATTANSSQHENDMQEDDEGIDMSTSTDNRTNASVSLASKNDSGPYLYELFAIMIHSGSASGGHYYAYIKEFENNEWFCFNDQTVSPVTQEDIQKSFGGSATKAYYTSMYSSSTNAYMLMYRQIDPKRNERATKTEDFPEYLNALLPKLNCEEEARHSRHTELALESRIKPRVYFYNPKLKKLKVTRVYVSRSFDLKFILESAYQSLMVEQFAPVSRCRLVAYDEKIIRSYEKDGDHQLYPSSDYLLEWKGENDEFETYEPGGVTLQAFKVNLDSMEVDGPHLVYCSTFEASDALKKSVAIRLGLKENEVLLATTPGHKVYVATDPNASPEAQDNFRNIVKKMFSKLTYFFLTVPNTDPDSLEIMSIPQYDAQNGVDVVDAVLMNGDASSEYHRRESPLPPTTTESNSEDSSLSDGDRTLVDTNGAMSSTSHSPQLSSPDESESPEMFHKINSILVDGPRISTADETAAQNLYFFADKIDADPPPSALNGNQEDSEDCNRKPAVMYKVIVDSGMKMAQLKRHLEALIRVPGNYFKVTRKYDTTAPIYPSHTLLFLNEGEMLIAELGKILQNDEHKAKVYFMRLSELNNNTGKLPCVCEWIFKHGMTVRDAKKQLVAQLHRIDAAKYKTLTVDNCRLWIKGGRNPVYFLNDDELLGTEGSSAISSEFLIQECEDGIPPATSDSSLTIFVRRWYPDVLELDKFQEITLEKHTDIKQKLASISDIPEENIAFGKVNSSFPCTNISMVSINTTMRWYTNPTTMDKEPLSTTVSGNVFFYKDDSVQLKVLTMEERREFNLKEKNRLDRLGCPSTTLYSPRRERALKIHLDLSPKNPSSSSVALKTAEGASSKLADE
ncbi:ubiquitin carboxyl-terminal hydrolase 47 isoform X2 [Eupeodes corollae]|uniref:ubiquitin carboxyl-terminal hydrolase 47 isoform X2 n=1 Tax=Eupeodes corollae TaxID=290404 RepID=UPI002491CB4E|nr:ubiquitin carboxyl-terminal hydrolase 47 isoform X2 [Eupeodes corollae]